MESKGERKYASEIERRKRPLKDVDAVERAHFIKAALWLAPASIVFFIAVTAAAIYKWGLSPGKALVVGLLLGLGAPWLSYGLLNRYFIGGIASLLGKLYYSHESTPRPPTSWRAQALSARGSHAEALLALEEDAALYPDDPGPSLRAAALCIQELDDREAAIRFYHRARKAAGTAPETDTYISIRLADIYEALGEPEQVKAEMQRILRLHPDSPHSAAARSRLAALQRPPAEET